MSESITLLSREESQATCQRKSPSEGFFLLASQFLAAIAEEATKKAYIGYESFPRLVKLQVRKLSKLESHM